MKVEYTGDEDQIMRKIELGTVSLPLTGTLMPGSLGLFGAKVETQWGKLKNTTILTQQKGERKEITVQGGAQTTRFDIAADNYEANRHYFLSGYFRDTYNSALAALPVVNSGVNITFGTSWHLLIWEKTLSIFHPITTTPRLLILDNCKIRIMRTTICITSFRITRTYLISPMRTQPFKR
jgi:hypothetical protein